MKVVKDTIDFHSQNIFGNDENHISMIWVFLNLRVLYVWLASEKL